MISEIHAKYRSLHPKKQRIVRDTTAAIATLFLFALSMFIVSLFVSRRVDESSDLEAFNRLVRRICGADAPIYLELPGVDQKSRQLMMLYLADRTIKGDWRDDGYLLRANPLVQMPSRNDCLIEPYVSAINQPGLRIGNFNIHTIGNEIRLSPPNPPVLLRHDQENRWLGAPQSASFVIEDFRDTPTKTQATFEIISKQPLNVDVEVDGTNPRTTKLEHDGKDSHPYTIQIQPGDKSITFKTDAKLFDIGYGLSAAYYIKNLQINPS